METAGPPGAKDLERTPGHGRALAAVTDDGLSGAARELIAESLSPNTRRAYAN